MDVKEIKTFDAPTERDHVWELLSDPWKMVTCLPGAELVEETSPHHYKGRVKLKIGPVSTHFEGTVEFLKVDSETYELSVKGQGADKQGKGNAVMQMDIQLKVLADGGTQVESHVNLNISGRIAQFGSRMIKAVNNKIFDQFTKNFLRLLDKPEEKPSEEGDAVKVGSVIGSVIKDSLKSKFSKKS